LPKRQSSRLIHIESHQPKYTVFSLKTFADVQLNGQFPANYDPLKNWPNKETSCLLPQYGNYLIQYKASVKAQAFFRFRVDGPSNDE
ncbi:hypothetical protein, partial [Bacillus velezensis]|uniref:hypothetical protein n=1 Tax=Bacillus velezensis TaxID=492670 RepID=UPI001C92E1D7